MSGESFLGALIGGLIANLIVGMNVRDDLKLLQAWADELASHLKFRRPKRHTPQVDP